VEVFIVGHMKDKIYLTGLIMISLSFIASVISFYLIVFTAPVFVVGSVIVLFSKESIRTKLLTILLPLLLWIPSTILFLYVYGLFI
jgi:hypothetical protein